MLLQTPDFHASSFNLLQSFCHSLLSFSLYSPNTFLPSPHPQP